MYKPALVLVASILAAAPAARAQQSYDTDILAETFGYDSSAERSVDLDDLQQGCPVRDCIPSIDAPVFEPGDEAVHVAPEDLVIAIGWRGDDRAYPSRILDQHEIVNDVIADTPIAITYCPLCGSAVGFRREIDGRVTEFGVSGLIYNSDLVIYDRGSETLWDQIRGEGIVGPLTGRRLERVPVTITRWSRWLDAHPDTLVLSDELGTGRDYTMDYYARYRAEDGLMFPVSRSSDALRPKTVVYGFDLDGHAVAFEADALRPGTATGYEHDGVGYEVRLGDDGRVTMTAAGSDEVLAPVRLFWFAWYTFHPDTDLVRADD